MFKTFEELLIEQQDSMGRFYAKGGGGSSGAVSWPGYMQSMHDVWLQNLNTKILQSIGSNPYLSREPFEPSGILGTMDDRMNDYENALVVSARDPWAYAAQFWDTEVQNQADLLQLGLEDVWGDFMTLAELRWATVTTDRVADIADTIGTLVNHELDSKLLPSFEAGMRDVNAVVTSSFVKGRSMIVSDASDRISAETAKAALEMEKTKLTLMADSTRLLLGMMIEGHKIRQGMAALGCDFAVKYMDARKSLANLWVECLRVQLIANREYYQENIENDVGANTWALELYQYGGNMLAAMSGGTHAVAGDKKSNKVATAIGGAVSMGATGAMLAGAMYGEAAGPWGAAIGAVIGLGVGLLSE